MRFILAACLCCVLASCARQVKFSDKGIIREAQIQPLAIEEPLKELRTGEKLKYTVDWIGIPAGSITLEVKEVVLLDGNQVYHIVARAMPNKFFKFFHNVEYTVHSYIDTSSMKSVRFYKERLLNGKLTKEETVFDYKNNEATWRYFTPELQRKISIPENNQDLLSALYSFRLENIKLGDSHQINIVYSGQAWPIQICLEKEEEIEVPGCGIFRVVVGKISSRLSSHITGFNNIEVFMSIDKKRLPVFFRMRTRIGYLSGVLSCL